MEVPKLGELITGPAGRDAVHVAVMPVDAGEPLEPGEWVGVMLNGKAYNAYAHGIELLGIVDPFLEIGVNTGERFYLCLLPGTVTSLRHVWTHPGLVVKVPEVANG